ncbi:MaoC/PaaZ C-terminal domain-containing protein [Sphingomonas solaris]|uniref:Dehydratase n=1 Tax=Alterirhizorhabdus solaris TaxID=2529389 RepID=A0A558RCT9_9SPHN|nr:MaoC/PaaZ C-terminal domain-containing protein [Sphingomonas solaris]TVV77186.1 dehydratase [Sphingomonas solaris]
MLDVGRLRAYAVPSHRDSYDPRDVILYALGTGAGLSDTVEETGLLFERRLKALPTMALVLGTPGFWAMDPKTGLDWRCILHGEQTLRLARPLASDDELAGTTEVGDIADKGLGKPALVRVRRTLRSLGGTIVAEMDETWVLRDAGGFGGKRGLPGPAPAALPERAPDAALDLPTARNQAALYRLSGDRNPLHIDPETARAAGFDRPILHGLATLGLAARAIVHLCCDGDPDRLSAVATRFTAPVLPGQTIRTEIWREDGGIQFRSRVADVTVMTGEATIDSFAPL